MRKTRIMLFLVFCAGFSAAARGEDNTWTGVNADGGLAITNVDNEVAWDLGRIPGVDNSDSAKFVFNSDNMSDIHIYSTNQFAPSSIYFDGNAYWNNVNRIYLEKDLSLSFLKVKAYGSTSAKKNNRFVISSGVTVKITDDGEVLDLMESDSWGAIKVDGDLVLSGNNIMFADNAKPYEGTLGGGGNLIFTNENSVITLGDVTGRMFGIGDVEFIIRTNQVWNVCTNSYVSMLRSSARNVHGDRDLILSPDEGRFDNLGELNIQVYQPNYRWYSSSYMRGVTYGSLKIYGNDAFGIEVILQGDVTFKRQFPYTDYALVLEDSKTYFKSSGYNVFLEDGGISMTKDGSVYVEGAELYVNGDIYSKGTRGKAGIYGNSETVVSVTGSISNNCPSVNSGGLYESTVNAVGNGVTQYFEV